MQEDFESSGPASEICIMTCPSTGDNTSNVLPEGRRNDLYIDEIPLSGNTGGVRQIGSSIRSLKSEDSMRR